MIKAVFFGTPPEAVPVLAGLLEVARVNCVVTRPDRPQGRGLQPRPAPVKVAARAWGLPVRHPEGDADLAQTIGDAHVAVVAAYGRLISRDVLALPPAGFLNVHFSLLPRWRGPSPVVRAILAGDLETGVTLMVMDEGLDTGAVVAREAVTIGEEETAGELTGRLASLGARLLARSLSDFVAGRTAAVAQDEGAATAAGKVTVDEAHLDPLRHGAGAMFRAIRAFNPRPGAWATVEGRRIKVLRAKPSTADVEPGMAMVDDGRVVLGAAGGSIELLEVQPEGRGPMAAVDWMNGRRGEPARFE